MDIIKPHKFHPLKSKQLEELQIINNEVAPNRLLGTKTASAAVLLSFVVFVAYFKLLNQIFKFKHEAYVLWIVLDVMAIICTVTVILLLRRIRRGLLKERIFIYAANSMYVEIFSEFVACAAETCGLVFQIICLMTDGAFETPAINHLSTLEIVVSDVLQAAELVTLPCCTLALSLVLHRLFERVRESNPEDHERAV